MNMKKVVILSLFFGTPGLSWALRVSPTYQNLQVMPGELLTSELTLVNGEEGEVEVKPSVTPFYSLPENKKFQVSDWLLLDSTPFTLKKGEARNVSFRVKTPKKAMGELAGNIRFETQSSQTGIISLALSLAVYAQIKGTQKPSLRVDGMSVALSSDTHIRLLLHNQGNIHLRPHGFVTVYDERNQVALHVAIQNGAPALPEQTRMFEGFVSNYRLSEGRYRADISLSDSDGSYVLPPVQKNFIVTSDGLIEAEK